MMVFDKKTIKQSTFWTNRKIILKLILGFGIIAILFFGVLQITHNKLSQLSEVVVATLEPNIKLARLKEIASCLDGAEGNVRSYTIRQDTAYMLSYENYINCVNSHLDTLQLLSDKIELTNIIDVKNNFNFSDQIDTLRDLIIKRGDLFNSFIALKVGKKSDDVFLQMLQQLKVEKSAIQDSSEQRIAVEESFLSKLFSSKKNKVKISNEDLPVVSSDSMEGDYRKMIVSTRLEEKIKVDKQLSQEMEITQRENSLHNRIFSILSRLEEDELTREIKRIHLATEETNKQISFISNWLTIFALILAALFSYFIYRDILRVKYFKEQLLLAKVDIEKLAAQYSLSLIEASRDPLVTINSEGKITDMNEATVNSTGIPREKLTGTDFFEYFTETQKAKEVYQDVFEKGSVADFPLTLRNKNGKLTDVLFNGSVYKDNDGKVKGVVVVARDITDQKRFENELIEAKSNAEKAMQKAEEATKLKEAFLANMSHEIRTPMNAIIGFSDILSKKDMGEQEKQYIKTIKSAGENLLTIINDILDTSKIEAGMMTFEASDFSVTEMFKSLNIMLMEKAKEKNLQLLFSCDENVPVTLLGDQTRLTQIIINLTGNAIKFTQTGTVQVQAKVLRDENETIIMEFSIIDTGIGIPEDKLTDIFKRFQQAESHTTRKFGGTGLGLSIAKQLVELQGGELSVKSELKKGSAFTVRIPYKKSTNRPLPPSQLEKKFNLKELSRLNILLVEDNRLNVLLISSLFSEVDFNLETAENGSMCIEMLKKKDAYFDIILMDMEMPVMNGYEATSVIRKELKNNIPIIAMTANAMAGEKEKCLSFGMNDYISKPIDAELLFEKMYDLTINLKTDDKK